MNIDHEAQRIAALGFGFMCVFLGVAAILWAIR